MTYIAGIDFGTSNSAVAISKNFERPKLITFDFKGKKYNTTPTVVSYCDDGRVLYGREAVEAYQQGDVDEKGRFIRSIKRIVSNDLDLYNSTRIGNKNIRFLDIVKNFFVFLKEHAEQEINHPIDAVVIGRPVSFVDDDKEADFNTQQEIQKLAEDIGFKNVIFQYEPIAAAFAYERQIKQETLALIVDIGAGTSDFSVIRLLPESQQNQHKPQDILANVGVNIAGNDFDYDFSLHSFMKYFGYHSKYTTGNTSLELPNGIFCGLSNWTQKTPDELMREYDKYAYAWQHAYEQDRIGRLSNVIHSYGKFDLLTRIENTKIYLTDKPEKKVNIGFATDDYFVTVSRDDLEIGLQKCLKKLQEKIDECIAKSGKNKTDIQTIIFTGGSSQIPVIQLNIIKMFPHVKPENIIKTDVFSSVCMGLAYYGINVWSNKQ